MSAVAAVTEAVDAIAASNGDLKAVTMLLEERALRRAREIDAAAARGERPGPLAGVPFLAKNLFDVEGVVTRAGSRATDGDAPAAADADAIRLLEEAGAILVGLTNMDEFAYGFVTQNQHDGATRNPLDLACIAGGSSGGSAAAVAAKMVRIAIGSDTNGSVRVPAALCGLFGFRPTFGGISKRGAFPLAYSLDTVGPLTRTADDLALAVAALRPKAAMGQRRDVKGLRFARLGGYFEHPVTPAVRRGVERVCAVLGVTETVEFPEPQRAREAAFLITSAEAGETHLARLRSRSDEYGDVVRERLIAAALTPSAWYAHALRFRTWLFAHLGPLFDRYDVLVAPTTPCEAPPIDATHVTIDGVELEKGPAMGTFTQPLALTQLPALSVPVFSQGEKPVGVQLIARWNEDETLVALAKGIAL